MNIDKHLREWLQHGLIDAAQANAIKSYELGRGQRPWAIYGVVGIGITALMTGIISLIAANWDDIPDLLKLLTYFLMQTSIGLACLRHESRPGVMREALLVLFSLSFLAGIGLVAQIYNLHGDGYQAIFFWLALTLPAALLAQRRLLSYLWCAGLGLGLSIWTMVDTASDVEMVQRMLIAISLGYVLAALGLIKTPKWCLTPRFAETCAQFGLFFVIVVLSFWASLIWSSGEFKLLKMSHRLYAFGPWFGCLLMIGAIALANPRRPTQVVWGLIGSLVAVTVFVTWPLLWRVSYGEFSAAVMFMLVWSFAGVAAVGAQKQRLFDVISFVIAVRFVVAYMQVFGDLMLTGIGLIVSGVVILAIAFAWYRFRSHIAKWIAKGGAA